MRIPILLCTVSACGLSCVSWHSVAAQSPSFDLGKAHLPDEIAICRTPELAELDNIIAAAYAYLKSTRGRAYAVQVGIPFWRLWRCPKTIASFRETSARCCSSILDGMSLGHVQARHFRVQDLNALWIVLLSSSQRNLRRVFVVELAISSMTIGEVVEWRRAPVLVMWQNMRCSILFHFEVPGR